MPRLFRGLSNPLRTFLRLAQRKTKKKTAKKSAETSVQENSHKSDASRDDYLEFPLFGTSAKLYTATEPLGKLLSFKAETRSHQEEGRYYLNRNEEDGEITEFPGVTTVLSQTVSRSSYFALRQWKKGLSSQLGEENIGKYMNEIRNIGSRFHQIIEEHLLDSSSARTIKSQYDERAEFNSETLEEEVEITAAKLKKKESKEVAQQEGDTGVMECSVEEPNLKQQGAEDTQSNRNGCQEMVADDLSEEEIVFDEDGADTVTPEVSAEEEPASLSQYNDIIQNLPEPDKFYDSVKHVLEDISDVMCVESVILHKDLGYMGRIDCVAKYKGILSLIDWKTSSKPRPLLKDMYDGPIQVAAYIGALNQDGRYPFIIKNAAIVVAYGNGDAADIHVLSEDDCQHYWKQWLLRLNTFKTQFASDFSDVFF